MEYNWGETYARVLRWFPAYTVTTLMAEPMCVVAYLNHYALKYETREIDLKEIQHLTGAASLMGGLGGAG